MLAALAGRSVREVVATAGGQTDAYRANQTPCYVENAWLQALQKNLMSAVLLVEAVSPFLEDTAGRVVLISSTAALDGQGGPYATAKAGLHGYARDLARRLGRRGITANVVAPGFVSDTGFFAAGENMDSEIGKERAQRKTLVGRVGTPADVTASIRWLLSAEGGWTTGQIISPNGGSHFVR